MHNCPLLITFLQGALCFSSLLLSLRHNCIKQTKMNTLDIHSGLHVKSTEDGVKGVVVGITPAALLPGGVVLPAKVSIEWEDLPEVGYVTLEKFEKECEVVD